MCYVFAFFCVAKTNGADGRDSRGERRRDIRKAEDGRVKLLGLPKLPRYLRLVPKEVPLATSCYQRYLSAG